MASESKTNTETTDVTPESQDVEQATEQATESTPENVGGEAPAGDAVQDTAAVTPAESTESKTSGGGGFAAGAVAVVSAALGLASLTGTSQGEMLRSRKEIIGQIESGRGGGGDQVEALYGAPWDTVAIANGVVAVFAVVFGGLVLALYAGRTDTRQWVKAVALAGMLLGVIGLGVAGAMYLDLFGSQPTLPQAPPMPGG